jgi:hypothetical protein
MLSVSNTFPMVIALGPKAGLLTTSGSR